MYYLGNYQLYSFISNNHRAAAFYQRRQINQHSDPTFKARDRMIILYGANIYL